MAFKSRNTQQKPEGEKTAPVASIRYGCLSASIWQQDGSNGVFYRVTAQRAFKREEDPEWSYTDSFGRDDLLIVAELMRQAFCWIGKREAEARAKEATR